MGALVEWKHNSFRQTLKLYLAQSIEEIAAVRLEIGTNVMVRASQGKGKCRHRLSTVG